MVCGFQREWPSQELRAGALPFRRTSRGNELLLIRQRSQDVWSVPKGQLMTGRALHETAAIEAYEEAGVRGAINPAALGSYLHTKRSPKASFRPHVVEVVLFLLEVEEVLNQWPEMTLRERGWFRPRDAIQLVAPGQLRRILAGLTPAPMLESELLGTEQN